MPDPIDALFHALEDDPGDLVSLCALADWFEEIDRPAPSRCLRWAATRGLRPFRYQRAALQVHSGSFHDGWLWWATGEPIQGASWGLPPSCRLPSALWRAMRHSFRHPPLVIKEYPTVRQAYEALLDAYPLLLPGESR